MLILLAEDFIHTTDIQKVLPLYTELIKKTRQETGCLSYDLTHDLRDPGHFIFIEKWMDETALQAHVESPHFKHIVPLIDQYTRKEAIYTRLAPLEEAFVLEE